LVVSGITRPRFKKLSHVHIARFVNAAVRLQFILFFPDCTFEFTLVANGEDGAASLRDYLVCDARPNLHQPLARMLCP
jgi:hypothetical protein